MPTKRDPNHYRANETNWTHGAKITLLAGILFILLNIVHIGYRFTIPSIGWAGPDPEELDVATPYFQLDVNTVGSPSGIQPGDLVIAINGIPATQILDLDSAASTRLETWGTEITANLTVLRDGNKTNITVPLVHWTLKAWVKTNFGNFTNLWEWLVTLLIFGAGAFTFLNRPGNLAARFLFAFGLSNLSITLGDSIPDYIGQWMDPPAILAKVFFSNIIFAYLLGPSFLGFTLSFPQPKKFIQRQSRWLLLPYGIGFITIVLLVVAPQFATIGFYLTFIMLLLGVVALIHAGFTMRDAISRAQLRWAIGGVLAGTALFMLNFASNQPPPYRDIILSIGSLGQPVIGFSLALAILRYRLFDIDVIIRRTLQYAILTGLLALIYFGGIVTLQGILGPLTGSESSPLITVISTLTIAALFNPLRHRIQDFIDRRFYRKKYNAEKTLSNFAAIARDEVDMDRLSGALLNVVKDTMQPENLFLMINKKDQN